MRFDAAARRALSRAGCGQPPSAKMASGMQTGCQDQDKGEHGRDRGEVKRPGGDVAKNKRTIFRLKVDPGAPKRMNRSHSRSPQSAYERIASCIWGMTGALT